MCVWVLGKKAADGGDWLPSARGLFTLWPDAASQRQQHPVHHHEVGDGAQQNEHMEHFVAAEPGIVPPGPLQGVQHAAHGVQDAPRQQPGHAPHPQGQPQGVDGENGQPAHGDIYGGGDGPGAVDPGQAHGQPRDGQRPHHAEQRPAPGPPQGDEAHRGVGPGDEEIDGGVVQFAQGDASLHRGVDAVVQGGRSVQRRHGQPVDGEGDNFPHVAGPGRAYDQHGSGQHAQHRAHPVGDGRPGAQAVIGIPALFHRPGLPPGKAVEGITI